MRQVPTVPTPTFWAVYERLDRNGCFVCQLRLGADGTYSPRVARFAPAIAPLPLSVYESKAAADRAADLLLYACAGTA